MKNEEKLKMFEKVLELEHLAEMKTYDGHDYVSESWGAYAVLEAIGMGTEYIKWSFGK